MVSEAEDGGGRSKRECMTKQRVLIREYPYEHWGLMHMAESKELNIPAMEGVPGISFAEYGR